MKVIYTNGIPICPYCKKPTERSGSGMETSTCMYFPPEYNKDGINVNPDRNIHSSQYQCWECGGSFGISGNGVGEYKYDISKKKDKISRPFIKAVPRGSYTISIDYGKDK